jgi:hypothetical protein
MAQSAGTINTLIGDRIGTRGQGWGEDETRANVIIQDLKTTAHTAEKQKFELNSRIIASLDEMKRENGFGLSTSVIITNCTGADMRLIKKYNYHGHIGRYPLETIIGPGQTAVFIHKKTSFSLYGSKAAFVYRVVTRTKQKKDILLAFNVSLRPPSRNRHRLRCAHVEIENVGHYSTDEESRRLRERIVNNSNREVGKAGLMVEGNIGESYSPVCQFTVKYDSTLGGPAK